MQDFDIKKFANNEFKSVEEVIQAIKRTSATTTNLNFVINLRNYLIEQGLDVVNVDKALFDLMREHVSLKCDRTGMSLFLWACHIGSPIWYQKIVDNIDLNEKDKGGFDAAFHAILGGSLIICKDLHKKGIDFKYNSQNKKPLLIDAASSKNAKVFDWMLENEISNKAAQESLLNFVIHHDSYDIVTKILGLNIDLSDTKMEVTPELILNPLEVALRHKNFNSAQALIDRSYYPLPLEGGDMALINALSFNEDEERILATIKKHYAQMVIKKEVNENGQRLIEIVNQAEDAPTVKKIFSTVDINPALDINLDDYSEDAQSLIYEAMF